MYAYVSDVNLQVDLFGLFIVYRLLREGEIIKNGISAKKPDRGMPIHGHVSSGSRNNGSQYISTSIDSKVLEKWKQPGQRMISFDTDDVIPDMLGNKEIIDISTIDKAKAHGVGVVSANMAASSKEVLIVGHVPANKIKCH